MQLKLRAMLLQVRQQAEAKHAELNAKVLQLESHIHWLQQDNTRLQDECSKQLAAAGTADPAGQQVPRAAAISSSELQVREGHLMGGLEGCAGLRSALAVADGATSYSSPPVSLQAPGTYITPRIMLSQVCCVLPLQDRIAGLESDLRKSKRAEQKLQALLYRLRQDVSQMSTDPGFLEQLPEVRSLEYEVDFLTNKCKVCSNALK